MNKKFSFTIAAFTIILFTLLSLLIIQFYLNIPAPGDSAVQQFLFEHRTPTLNTFFISYTFFFGNIGGVITASLVLLFLIFWRKFIAALWFVLLAAISTAANIGLKSWINRARPLEKLLLNESSSSFPSGHSVFATVLFFSLFFILIQQLHSRFLKGFLFILTLILTFLVMVSRIYVGVHYLSDTIGGFLEGIFFITLTYPFFYHFSSKTPDSMNLLRIK